MGNTNQTDSKGAEIRRSYIRSLNDEKQKYLKEMTQAEQEENSGCLNGWPCFPRQEVPNIYDTDWKPIMIEQLELLEMEGNWPKLLLEHLKKNNTESTDMTFQADIYWADFNHTKNSKIPGRMNPSILSSGRESLLDEDFDLSQGLSASKNPIDKVVDNLVESSDILDESFFTSHSKETWMNRSFNINLPENKPRRQTFVPMGAGRRNSRYVENYRNNTFVNSIPTSSPMENLKHQTNDLYSAIAKYKMITNLMDKHFRNEKNIFCQVFNIFRKYYHDTYTPIVTALQSSKAGGENEAAAAVVDLQQFIRVIFETVNHYYQLDKLRNKTVVGRENIFNRDNMLNFITSSILDESIYNILWELLKIADSSTEEAYQKNLRYCRKLGPQDMGVPDQFCLNEKTVEFFREKGLLSGVEVVFDNKKGEIETIPEFSETYEANEESKLEASSYKENSVIEKMETYKKKVVVNIKPFEKSINVLSNLEARKSPIHKLKTIVKAAELITVAIDDFYTLLDQKNTKKLDADQTLSIFMYILAQSEVTNVSTHYKIIEKLSTNNVLNSVSGYYATTLEACVSFICTMNVKHGTSIHELKSSMRSMVQNFSLLQSKISINQEEKLLMMEKRNSLLDEKVSLKYSVNILTF